MQLNNVTRVSHLDSIAMLTLHVAVYYNVHVNSLIILATVNLDFNHLLAL